ncbi:MAG: dephospho-CoA kinase [Neisseriaceae bacterium]|nr:dephospho-CoA kinase [Neisseriaceae bacterium]
MTHWIGLTGGIGSGKSTVANLFSSRHGIPIIDTDEISHSLTSNNGIAIPLLKEEFGGDFIDVFGNLKRDKMRRAILQDSSIKKILEYLLHPLILREVKRQQLEIKSCYGFVVVPLLLEVVEFQKIIERILLIDCSEEIQIERIQNRNKLTYIEAKSLLSIQSSREQRLSIADDIIDNYTSIDSLLYQIDDLHQFYLRYFHYDGN